MKNAIPKALIVSVMLFSALVGTQFITKVEAQTTPTVSVIFPNATNSSLNEYRIGDTFRVDIVVNSPDIGIWSWQVGIHFNKDILQCTNLGEGDFFAGKYTLGFMSGTINNTLGYVTISSNSLRDPETTGVNGTGVLMWFEFNVIGYGSCLLDLTLSPPDLTCGTKLNERVDTDVVPISPIILYDGSFDNTELTPPVGDTYIPVKKLELLAPYIGLTILLAIAITTVVYVKKRKRHTENLLTNNQRTS
jgi:hypothetical protein